ncbi:Xaa-Pro aminopeptidase 3 [Geodia barretti]|nr:Xaa-Pro aminopeptidase 3 [Geodia barretti]
MDKAEFAQRRSRLMELVANTHTGMTNPHHLVIIPGAPTLYMSQDVPYRFHQNTDLFYLTGFQEPDCVLLLETIPHSSLPSHTSTLYVRPRDPHREQWDGPRPGPEGTVDFTGVDQAYNLDDLPDHLEKRYSGGDYSVWYYTESTPHPEQDQLITSSLTRSPISKIKSVHSPSHQLQELRLTKSPAELVLMRRAADIACLAFTKAMEATRPGLNEHQLESVFEHSVKMSGAQRMSFPPVVAGGPRATCLHYITNNRDLLEGEMVLVDAGCQYFGYVSDITRTWPVSGKFTPAQRDLYQLVLTVKQESIEMCRAGVTLNYLNSLAVEMLADGLIDMGLMSDRLSPIDLSNTMGRLFPHHLGHYLGLDTHDTMLVDRNTELEPGMVLTIEPGVYLPQDYHLQGSSAATALAGCGIRLEDNVAVNEDGREVLSHSCPQTTSELTRLIGTRHH